MPYIVACGIYRVQKCALKGWIVAQSDKALYRRAGYPVSVSAGQTPAVNTTAVESAQNGFVGKGKRARRGSLRANDGQNGARVPFYIVRPSFTDAEYFCPGGSRGIVFAATEQGILLALLVLK